jgi:hypothetical protein
LLISISSTSCAASTGNSLLVHSTMSSLELHSLLGSYDSLTFSMWYMQALMRKYYLFN